MDLECNITSAVYGIMPISKDDEAGNVTSADQAKKEKKNQWLKMLKNADMDAVREKSLN